MVEWGVEGKNALYPISGLRDVRCPLKGGVVTTCTVQWAHSEPYSIVSEPARFCHNLLASHSRAELRQPHIPRWRSQLHIKAGISCRTQRLALVSCRPPALTLNIRLIASSKSQTKRCLLQEKPPPTRQYPAINYVSLLSCIDSIISSVSSQRVSYFEYQSVTYWATSEVRQYRWTAVCFLLAKTYLKG